MAYLAQPVIVGSPNVVVIEDARMNLTGNIVRSSHYIPDPSSTPSSADPHSLHPTLKSLPYPLTLPPVMNNNNNNNNTSGADLANFEEDEDEDTEDSRSLMSAVTAESLTDNNSVLLSTSYNSRGAIGVVGSFRENVIPTSGSLRGQGSSAANVRSQSRSPVAYHRIPVGLPYPVIPTVPSAAVAVVGGSFHNNGTTPSGSTLADRVPGSRVQVPELTPSNNVVEKHQNASEECNVCHLDISPPSTAPQPTQAPVSPLSTSPSRQTSASTTITSTCSSTHTYHLTCFQTSLLQPAITRTTLPKCPAPCNQHIPARCFLHVVNSEMKRRYLKSEMEVVMAMDGEDCDF